MERGRAQRSGGAMQNHEQQTRRDETRRHADRDHRRAASAAATCRHTQPAHEGRTTSDSRSTTIRTPKYTVNSTQHLDRPAAARTGP